jgi:hypothetical protein
MSRRAAARRGRGRISADLIVVLVLFAALVAFSAYTTAHQAEKGVAPAYSTHSTAPNGAAALYLWLDALGFQVERIEGGPFVVADEADLLFVLAPRLPYEGLETRALKLWAQEPAHTLVVVAHSQHGIDLAESFDIQSAFLPAPASALTPTVPLLVYPPPGVVQANARQGLQPEGDDFVAHLQAGETPVFISQRYGSGRLILSASPAPFTNAGLNDPGSARLVHNLVAGLEPGALVQFDEVHHGYGGGETADTLLGWLYRSPWGWALFYCAAVLFVWMLLRGRRFGRPIPLPERISRRRQSEYVVSMAGLFRRARRRTFVMRYHHHRLKRALARPWRLNPDLPDAEFVAELARYRDDLDEAALRDLLARLAGERLGEAELVRAVGEVDAWLAARS